MDGGGGNMKTSPIATAGGRFRASLLPDFVEYAPLRWLVLSGLVLMAAIAIGTTLTISKFRDSAIETGKQELESAVLLLARHFDQHWDDFAVLQTEIVAELQAQEISQPDIFKSEMGTLAIHEMLRDKASGWPDVAGVNLFDLKGGTDKFLTGLAGRGHRDIRPGLFQKSDRRPSALANSRRCTEPVRSRAFDRFCSKGFGTARRISRCRDPGGQAGGDGKLFCFCRPRS